jgi:hypothetical protein
MRNLNLSRCALSVCLAALLAGCGGPQGAGSTMLGSGVTPNGFGQAMPDMHRRNREALYEYVSNYGQNSSLLEFDYPKSDKSIGQIPSASGLVGECGDVLHGAAEHHFWVVAFNAAEVEEFVVGGTSPIKTLSVKSVGIPLDCAMDPGTGNLAVTIYSSYQVVIFANARGPGRVYSTPLEQPYYGGYDNHGNLYVDGLYGSYYYALAELPKGSSTFEVVKLTNYYSRPTSAVQYDGEYLTIGEEGGIARYSCSGSTCVLKGTVKGIVCVQSWIGKGVVFCPRGLQGTVEIYKYPAGGSPIASLTGPFDDPQGVVQVSK